MCKIHFQIKCIVKALDCIEAFLLVLDNQLAD